ncbi:hypothetical protein WI61_14915 [Burkholderia cepacia]|uniref:hypothetical protein n=1 Tax=Burkholderia cepacia TaxID=292 RepID=UPI0007557B19|nr:hypothetical protein [Burkholderia cepacia]KVA68673.1 hypothetical protein WI49_07535 [Burkholderia cepacia]KVA69089.1 hypothetical protein WI48_29245 [Burkholderia cepacia]KVA83457.1 hypothetical protein WI50_19070 [Burkholderia cepacia]KVA95430.1 hypothetical protein WI52_34360 [Burkholderia cepacia]KVA96925.1 hypothetical protein WI51_33360 [Burkholderia cepacia]
MFQITISTRRFSLSIDQGTASLRIGSPGSQAAREFLLLRDYVERNRKPRLLETSRDTEARSWEALVMRRWLVSSSPA